MVGGKITIFMINRWKYKQKNACNDSKVILRFKTPLFELVGKMWT